MAIEEEWGVVGRPLSLCAHDKCDLFQVVVLVILMFTRQLAQSGFECLIGSTINPDGQWLTILYGYFWVSLKRNISCEKQL